jgi:hypothetical protein
MLYFLWSVLTNKWVILNNVICFLMVEWAFRKLKPLYPKTESDKIRDEKYPSFSRRDLDRVSRPWFFLLAPTIFIKATLAYGSLAILSIIIFFISVSHKRGEPYSGWKYDLIKTSCRWSARNVLFMVSVLWVDEIKVDYDYTKYLGEDWKPTNAKPGSIVSNH